MARLDQALHFVRRQIEAIAGLGARECADGIAGCGHNNGFTVRVKVKALRNTQDNER
jgi:hypothetical protein